MMLAWVGDALVDEQRARPGGSAAPIQTHGEPWRLHRRLTRVISAPRRQRRAPQLRQDRHLKLWSIAVWVLVTASAMLGPGLAMCPVRARQSQRRGAR